MFNAIPSNHFQPLDVKELTGSMEKPATSGLPGGSGSLARSIGWLFPSSEAIWFASIRLLGNAPLNAPASVFQSRTAVPAVPAGRPAQRNYFAASAVTTAFARGLRAAFVFTRGTSPHKSSSL